MKLFFTSLFILIFSINTHAATKAETDILARGILIAALQIDTCKRGIMASGEVNLECTTKAVNSYEHCKAEVVGGSFTTEQKRVLNISLAKSEASISELSKVVHKLQNEE